MAKAATPANMAKEHSNINYQAAIEIIQGDILALQSDQKKLAKEAGTAWKEIEDLGVNKAGAQAFAGLLKKPVDIRRDMFRTFVNLAKAANWFDWLNDLVDQAQGNATPAPIVQAPGAPAPIVDHPKDDSDLAGGADGRPMVGADDSTRIDLKTRMLQKSLGDDKWDDIRPATPKELAAERDRIADFDDKGPDVPAAKAVARAKAGGAKPDLKSVK